MRYLDFEFLSFSADFFFVVSITTNMHIAVRVTNTASTTAIICTDVKPCS